MRNLVATLHDYDPGMLPALAEVWGVDSTQLRDDELITGLQNVMLDPRTVETIWDKLEESTKAALQLLVSSAGQRMKTGQFERFYGRIRKMGRGQIQKEQPHLAAQSIAEALYYRGLIGEAYDKVGDNVISFVYVPTDLIDALPLHKTSYERLDADETSAADELPGLALIDDVSAVTPADTSIIDDLTTLLAYLQANSVAIQDGGFADDVVSAIMPHLLHGSEIRLGFMLGLAVSAKLLTRHEDRAQPQRDPVRNFLSGPRSEQIKLLSRAWLECQNYRDLWHVPGLYPDDSGWSYDAAAARHSVMSILGELVPEQGWISVNDLIEVIKDVEPDFQRPDGDYDSWYIRNAAGEFLKGFESWDAVEGSLIEFYLIGPMHWLGLVDIGEDVVRLTAYGRSFLGFSDWPQPVEAAHKIDLRNDGAFLVTRRVNRFERFQLARFAQWVGSGDPYVYRLDGDSLQRAAAQNINAGHIQAFIARHLDGKPLPIPIAKLLRGWQDGARTSLSFESLTVLRTNSEEALDRIFAMPVFRRYLGARLGPMACIIREDQSDDLREKLGEHGVEVDTSKLQAAAE